MARASNVYVALDEKLVPGSAFTVKHEAKTWLRRSGDAVVDNVRYVIRIPDGGGLPTVAQTREDFLASR